MGRYFALTLEIPQAKIKMKSKIPKKLSSNFGYVLAGLLIVASIFYLIETNSISTKGYEIKKLDNRLLELRESNKRLELEAASLKSIQSIESQVRILNLVPNDAVGYFGQNGYAYSP